MTTPRIGVIGVGQIGKQHLDNYRKLGRAQVVAIADVNAPELQRVAGVYDVPHAHAAFR
jgi:predicted dehydrogenase